MYGICMVELKEEGEAHTKRERGRERRREIEREVERGRERGAEGWVPKMRCAKGGGKIIMRVYINK